MSKIFGLSSRQLFLSVGLILVFASGIYCGNGDPQVKTFNLSIVEQKLEGQDSNLLVNKDDNVNIVIHSDKDVLFHLHGYDIEKLVRMDEPTNINFFANATGSFPFTIHYGETISEHNEHEQTSGSHHEDGHGDFNPTEGEIELGRLDVFPN